MAADLKIYPLDYDSSTPGVGDGPSVLDVAVNGLEREAKLTALRQAYARRQSMRAAVASQNEALLVIDGLMPLVQGLEPETDEVLITIPFLGSFGIAMQGTQVHQFSFATETFELWSTAATSNTGSATGTIYNDKEAYSISGQVVFRLDYQIQSVETVGFKYPESIFATSSGIGDRVKGYFFGGYISGGKATNLMTRFNYKSKTFSEIGNNGTAGGYAAGLSSKTKGYLCGRQDWYTETGTIEAVDYTTEVVAAAGASAAAASMRAGFGNATKGYLAGGKYIMPSLSSIQKLTFDPIAVTTLGATLSTAKVFWTQGFGSSTKGYAVAGGLRDLTKFNTIESLNYTTETVAAVGTFDFLDDNFGIIECAANYAGGIE